jgi:hypothetical protein
MPEIINAEGRGIVGVKISNLLLMSRIVCPVSNFSVLGNDGSCKVDALGDVSLLWKGESLKLKGVESAYPLILAGARSIVKIEKINNFFLIIDIQDGDKRIVEVAYCNEESFSSAPSIDENPELDQIERIFDSLSDDENTPVFYLGNHQASYLGILQKDFLKVVADESKDFERFILSGINIKTALRLVLFDLKALSLAGTTVGAFLWVYTFFQVGSILNTLTQYGPNLMNGSIRPLKDELITSKSQFDAIQARFQQVNAKHIDVKKFAGLVKISIRDGAVLSNAQLASDGKFGGNLGGEPKTLLRTIVKLRELGKLNNLSFNVNSKGEAVTPFTLEARVPR